MKWLAYTGLAATLVVAMALGLFLAWAVSEGIPPGTAVIIDGDRFEVGRLGAVVAEHWFLTGLAVLLLAAVLVVVVPLVIVLAIGLPLLFSALGMALVLAPLGLLLWWLWRSQSRPAPPPTTMQR